MTVDLYDVLVSVGKAVKREGGWGTLERRQIGYTFQAGDYEVVLVAKVTDPGYPANGYDGAYEQGSEFEASIVVKVAEQFFKKTGTGDSYGDVSWDGDLLPAKLVEKVVQSFE